MGKLFVMVFAAPCSPDKSCQNLHPDTRTNPQYKSCPVTVFWLKYQDRDRMLRRVTQPPHIAGPLCCIIRMPHCPKVGTLIFDNSLSLQEMIHGQIWYQDISSGRRKDRDSGCCPGRDSMVISEADGGSIRKGF